MVAFIAAVVLVSHVAVDGTSDLLVVVSLRFSVSLSVCLHILLLWLSPLFPRSVYSAVSF